MPSRRRFRDLVYGWPETPGITGRIAVEWVAGLPWNPHQDSRQAMHLTPNREKVAGLGTLGEEWQDELMEALLEMRDDEA